MDQSKEEKESTRKRIVSGSRRWLIIADDFIHIAVALFLLSSALLILGRTALHFQEISTHSILAVINDVLFVLIIMELLWTVIRFLGRKSFSLGSFLIIGIIGSIRKMLMVEAHMSMGGEVTTEKFYQYMMEMGLSAAIVFILIVAYYLVSKLPPATE
ncbi:MAG: phosphate-starvation-inducible PsiE family protein [Deltaproteobacteria bacterium]|nr:phosphate-starvation-inducible PsiE family protein [Deltaproteobacteria bacterium]